MFTGIDIVATKLGAARPVAILDNSGHKIAFYIYPRSRFGFPLSLAEYKKSDGRHYRAFYSSTIGKFPGRNPSAMVFGIVAGDTEALIYDRFGLAAHLTSAKPRVIRKKLRISASHSEINDAISSNALTPLAPISGKVVVCPACESQPVRLKSFLEEWKRAGRTYIQMPLCHNCASMVSAREWLGSVLCRNCGSRTKENADTCSFCGKYPHVVNMH